jgi:hypothetical protein
VPGQGQEIRQVPYGREEGIPKDFSGYFTRILCQIDLHWLGGGGHVKDAEEAVFPILPEEDQDFFVLGIAKMELPRAKTGFSLRKRIRPLVKLRVLEGTFFCCSTLTP